MNISPVISLDDRFSEKARDIESNFKCDWNDNVHESYRKYVMSIQDSKEKVHSIRCKTEMIDSEIMNLNIDNIEKESDSLCQEADAI